jgi:hypothetical protein
MEVRTSDEMKRIVELANELVWKTPDLDLLREHPENEYALIAQTLQTQLKKSHARGTLFLPDLRAFDNTSVGVFSDYGGESTGDYYVYSALVCGYGVTGVFNTRMKSIRAEHHLGDKEIAFKDFGMGQLLRALPDYLAALNNSVPGFLCSVVVDKKLTTLFGSPEDSTLSELLRAEGLGNWKPQVAEKLLRVVHLTAFLAALLTHNGQKIIWMSDHDAICPNEKKHTDTLSLFGRVLGVYTRPGCTFPIVGGAMPFAERSVEMMDLLSAPDVVAGSLGDYLTKRDSMRHDEITVKEGTREVLRWLTHDGLCLKKATFVLRRNATGGIEGGTLEFQLPDPAESALLVPIRM